MGQPKGWPVGDSGVDNPVQLIANQIINSNDGILQITIGGHIMTTAKAISFSFQETHDVRIQIIIGEPWFCLRDICGVLDVENHRDLMAKQLDKKGVEKIYTLTKGGNQQLVYVNEPNLYRVIFRSNKPEAKQFQDWVFNEVLPSIRKTGRYDRHQPQPQPQPKAVERFTHSDTRNLTHLVCKRR